MAISSQETRPHRRGDQTKELALILPCTQARQKDKSNCIQLTVRDRRVLKIEQYGRNDMRQLLNALPRLTLCAAITLPFVTLTGCFDEPNIATVSVSDMTDAAENACDLVLSPSAIAATDDSSLAKYQQLARQSADKSAYLERLGWLFIDQATRLYDEGFYRLSNWTADCMDQHAPGADAAQLLRAYSLHQQHQFAKAEAIAKSLTQSRGQWFDFAVYGDILFDVGKVSEAEIAYAQVMRLKPGPQAYIRGAELKYAQGDLEASVELLKLAAKTASPRTPAGLAWTLTRLAERAWQLDGKAIAARVLDRALDVQNDYPQALFLKSLMLMDDERYDEALKFARAASETKDLPQYHWVYIDALKQTGNAQLAEALVKEIRQRGVLSDPRMTALYLATEHIDPQRALELATDQAETRPNAASLDALAWALLVNNEPQAAWDLSQQVIAMGAPEPRFFLHAAIIANANGKPKVAAAHLKSAHQYQFLLMQSEKMQLTQLCNDLALPCRESA